MSEGRRRFADRLAGIESGAECDRLAPQLSALADGEARAADMAVLRPHLRTCLMCRARLRDYRTAPARVAAMSVPVAASGLLAAARDAFGGVGAWFAERSASLAVRWHQAAELAVGHKVAAVVASSAALAGGGAATVATVTGPAPEPRARAVAPAVPIPEPRDATSPPTSAPATAAQRREEEDRRTPSRTAAEPPLQAPSPPGPTPTSGGEFAPEEAGEPVQTPVPNRGVPGGEGGEFAP